MKKLTTKQTRILTEIAEFNQPTRQDTTTVNSLSSAGLIWYHRTDRQWALTQAGLDQKLPVTMDDQDLRDEHEDHSNTKARRQAIEAELQRRGYEILRSVNGTGSLD